jgi:arylsulfatase A-like enzyme/Flp pilus assembly protein TadD
MATRSQLRVFVAALFFATPISAFFPAAGVSTEAHKQSPSMILVTIDTTRADRMGFLGSKRGLTPNLDALAQQSVVFTRTYAQVPLTTPSHAVLLTGTYPQFNHIEDLGASLSKDLPYLPELLRNRGYRTAAFVGSYVLDPAGTAPGFERGFDMYDAHFHERERGEDRYHSVERRAAEVLSHAMTWLSRQPPGPFFIWLHFYDPHDPYDPPEPFKTRYAAEPYDGEIAYADWVIGGLVDVLRKHDLYQNTVIAIASDHGEAFGEHGEQRHGMFLYDETIHVPLLLKLPDHRFAGKRVEDRVALVDLAPTLLETVGVPVPSAMQGHSLVPLFDKDRGDKDRDHYDQPTGEAAVYSQSNYARAFGWSGLSAWRTTKYLYIKAPKRELYDQNSDSEARHNLADASPAVADTLDFKLTKFQQDTSSAQSAAAKLDPAQSEKLRALGYMPSDPALAASQPGNALIDPKDKIDVANQFHRAAVDFEEDRYDEGIATLRDLLKREPGMAGASMELGRALYREQRYEEALPCYRSAAEKMPASSAAHYELALTLVKTKDWEAALPEARVAAKLASDSAQVHYFLAMIELHLKQLPEATADILRSLEIDPDHFAANLKYGEMLLIEGHPDEALPRLKHASELDPNSAEAHRYLADTYHQLGRSQEESSERAKGATLKDRPQD